VGAWYKKSSRTSPISSIVRMAPCASLLLPLFAILATLPIIQSVPTFFPGPSYDQSLAKIPKASKPKIPYKTHYFPQVLDHFTFQPKSSKIFYQKYLVNSHYWHRGAPIFVYTGNEGDIEWFAANTGFLLDIAPKFRALLVFIEVLFLKKLHNISYWLKTSCELDCHSALTFMIDLF